MKMDKRRSEGEEGGGKDTKERCPEAMEEPWEAGGSRRRMYDEEGMKQK
jgi:hypothetical protein